MPGHRILPCIQSRVNLTDHVLFPFRTLAAKSNLRAIDSVLTETKYLIAHPDNK